MSNRLTEQERATVERLMPRMSAKIIPLQWEHLTSADDIAAEANLALCWAVMMYGYEMRDRLILHQAYRKVRRAHWEPYPPEGSPRTLPRNPERHGRVMFAQPYTFPDLD